MAFAMASCEAPDADLDFSAADLSVGVMCHSNCPDRALGGQAQAAFRASASTIRNERACMSAGDTAGRLCAEADG
ncbi:MAG: hypothetical protein LPK90_05900, partial [Alphaproteobacteria bacterium]|nr:hypothetical protein [Alphaproteobacteria bacterium]MDX5493073.1 hypothetical protein [Alphaproteobacteria bacterium]